MRFPISGLIMLCIAGILFFLFVMFNYAYNGEGGFVEIMRESANKTMTGGKLDMFNQQQAELAQMFGMGAALCFTLAIVFFVIDVLGDRREY